MYELGKSKSNLELFGMKSTKNFNTFGKELQNTQYQKRIQPSYSQILNKSSYVSQNNNKSIFKGTNTQKKMNDCLKKLIFDNQQLMRKGRQLENRCSLLEQSNQQLSQKYEDMKSSYLIIRKLFQVHQIPIEHQLLEKHFPKKQPQIFNIFGFLMNGVQQSTTKRISNKESNFKNSSKKQPYNRIPLKHKLSIKQSSLLSPGQKSRKIIPSVSLMIDVVQMATQTDFKLDDMNHLSPSSKQTELIKQITQQNAIIEQLQKKINEVSRKYQKIKSIIGGHDAKFR